LGHAFKQFNHLAIKYLLQISVVGLGFGLNFGEVINQERRGLALNPLFKVCYVMGIDFGRCFAGY
jgi:uncharacterized membrane protein YadS